MCTFPKFKSKSASKLSSSINDLSDSLKSKLANINDKINKKTQELASFRSQLRNASTDAEAELIQKNIDATKDEIKSLKEKTSSLAASITQSKGVQKVQETFIKAIAAPIVLRDVATGKLSDLTSNVSDKVKKLTFTVEQKLPIASISKDVEKLETAKKKITDSIVKKLSVQQLKFVDNSKLIKRISSLSSTVNKKLDVATDTSIATVANINNAINELVAEKVIVKVQQQLIKIPKRPKLPKCPLEIF